MTGRGPRSWWVAAAGVALLVGGGLAWLAQAPGTAGHAERPVPDHAPVRKVADAVPAPRVPGAPRRLVVPRLHVDAPVEPVRAPGGTLVPPSDPQRLGWWAGGALPGAARGSALVTGHTVHTGGGALDDLERLRPGDAVLVRTDRGPLRYAVQRVAVYTKGAVARHAEQLFSQRVPGRLVLVTCEDWDGREYLANVVVIATPVP